MERGKRRESATETSELSPSARVWFWKRKLKSGRICGTWVVDISTIVIGKRKRSIKAFGSGSRAEAEARAYCEEVAPQARAAKFWERQTATFSDLWHKFEAHELIGPTPGWQAALRRAPGDVSPR
jgi:hypothetical protein